MLKAVLFDLDGTLLPMDQEEFVRRYLELLCRKMAPYGYEPQPLIKAIWDGTGAMVKNDGSCTNEEAFWRHFLGVYGESAREHVPLFEEFYAVEFQQARDFCGFTPRAAEILALVKERGLRPILATNPLFPAVATGSRARWAGLEPEDFALITTYENSRFCKPDPAYYREILKGQILLPEECLMVGNDAEEDMIAESLGMRTFLLTDCLINRRGTDITRWPHGGYEELRSYIESVTGSSGASTTE